MKTTGVTVKIKVNQLAAHLKTSNLSMGYLLIGEEPLQQMECADAIRETAVQQGFNERTVLSVEAHFNWQQLTAAASGLSLFATKRLIELRLSDKIPDKTATETLSAYFANPPQDTILIMSLDKLPAANRKSAWFEAFDKSGIIIEITLPDDQQLPAWLAQRLAHNGIKATPQAIALLAERTEGHLLAAAQEIEKLKLLFPNTSIDESHILESVADSARFAVFDWLDTVIAGHAAKAARQLHHLRAEGLEAAIMGSLLTREIRTLCQLAHAKQQGQTLESLFPRFKIWQPAKKSAVSKAISRHSVTKWQQLVQQTTLLDRTLKGMHIGNVWDQLLFLTMQVAGVSLKIKVIS